MTQETERAREILMDDAFVKHMTERFLSWRLPENFNPDCGITAQRPNYGPNVKWEPTGTNLLDYTQAEAMVRHMLEGAPDSSTPQTSEEVVEAVARAIERADNETGYEYDHLHIECSDWGIHLARAAIAAMSSIPQESDAEVTEAMREAGRATYSAVKQGKCGVRTVEELCGDIYTAMTSARDREQPK